tara:strand:+ start:276 stop:563 length:288 start_codon:yes stop_codon:yes gene_type:complete
VAAAAAAAAVAVPVAADMAALGEAAAEAPPPLLHLSTALCTQRIHAIHHGGGGDSGSVQSAAFPRLGAVTPNAPATAAGTDVDADVAARAMGGEG